MRTLRVKRTLTTAQIIAMGSAAVTLVAAPGAGKAIIFLGAILKYNRGTTSFTGAGATTINLGSGGAVSGSLAATAITAASSTVSSISSAGSSTTAENQPLTIGATSAFAAGDGNAEVIIAYKIVNL
jgi:hypothetical protein